MIALKSCTSFFDYERGKDAGKKEQVIEQLDQDIKDTKKLIDAQKDISDIQIDTVVDVVEEEKKIDKKIEKKIIDSKKKINNVKEDPSISEIKKDEVVAEIEIVDLWDAYCSVNGATCPTEGV